MPLKLRFVIKADSVSEFELIRRYFCSDTLQPDRRDVCLGIGDDCALISVPEGKQLVVSVDTSVAGVHFPEDADPYDIGWRALAVSLSDLAAMGAKPAWFTLALTLPEGKGEWLQSFSQGISDLARRFGIALVGGDTTHGALSVTVQVQGYVSPGAAWKRSGAKPGDLIYVSGSLGDAAGGLEVALNPELDLPEYQSLKQAYLRPEPRFDLLSPLSGRVRAAIDISDGFLADLNHVLKASGVGAVLDPGRIPVSSSLKSLLGEDKAFEMAISGGDDYQLCFMISPKRRLELEVCADQSHLQSHPVGVITSTPGIEGLNHFNSAGFDHFGRNH